MERSVKYVMYYYLEYYTSEEINKYTENILREFDSYSDMARYIETHSSKGYGCLIPVHMDEVSNVTQYLFVPMDKVITRMDSGTIRMSMVLKGDHTYPLGKSKMTFDKPEAFYPIIFDIDRLRFFNKLLARHISNVDLPWYDEDTAKNQSGFLGADIDYFEYELKGTNLGDLYDSFRFDYNNDNGIYQLIGSVTRRFYSGFISDIDETLWMDSQLHVWTIIDNPEWFEESLTNQLGDSSQIISNVSDIMLISDYVENILREVSNNVVFHFYLRGKLVYVNEFYVNDVFDLLAIILNIDYYIQLEFLYLKLFYMDIYGISYSIEDMTVEFKLHGLNKRTTFTDHISFTRKDEESTIMKFTKFICELSEDNEI